MGLPTHTKGGYVVYEVVSALQKDIRRGHWETAFFWAIELIDSGLPYWAFKRLRVTAMEDVGMAAVPDVMFALKCLDLCQEWFNEWWKAEKKANKEGGDGENTASRSWELPLVNAIYTLCRASKTRFADHFKTAIYGRRAKGWHPPIPDYALDKHTHRGKALGRGVDHFVDEGGKLEPCGIGNTIDTYKEEARHYWKDQEEAGYSIKAYPDKSVKRTEEIPYHWDQKKKGGGNHAAKKVVKKKVRKTS